MATVLEKLNDIAKALEAGFATGAPGTLTQGAALGKEDLSPVMNLVTYQEKHLKLSKVIPTEKATQTLVQYDRQLDYGNFGGSATLEVSAGQENTSSYVRAFVPMAFYADRRVVSFVSQAVQTFDGKKNLERESMAAAMKIAGDVEFDLFRGKADFSNAGVFDGNMSVIPGLMPSMLGIDPQVRQSDSMQSTQDLMFAEYGSALSVVIAVGGVLQQTNLEDAALRSANNFGQADILYMSTDSLANYNKIVFSKERIILAGSPQTATGGNLGMQWTSNGPVQLESSNFLRAKTQAPVRISGLAPNAPTATGARSGGATAFLIGQVYSYYVTASNEAGESPKSANLAVTTTANGDQITLTITPSGSGQPTRWFNVYRSAAGTSLNSTITGLKFIGRVSAAATGSTSFIDLGNKLPGGTTGFFLDKRGMEVHELIPFTSVDLAQVDTSHRKLFYRDLCLAVKTPRFNVILAELT